MPSGNRDLSYIKPGVSVAEVERRHGIPTKRSEHTLQGITTIYNRYDDRDNGKLCFKFVDGKLKQWALDSKAC